METEIAGIDKMLADPLQYKNVLDDRALYNRYNSLKKELEDLMNTWEEQHLQAESMKESNKL